MPYDEKRWYLVTYLRGPRRSIDEHSYESMPPPSPRLLSYAGLRALLANLPEDERTMALGLADELEPGDFNVSPDGDAICQRLGRRVVCACHPDGKHR